MAISQARSKSLLLGQDATVSLRGVAVAVGLFVAVFSVMSLWLDQSISVIGSVFYVLLFLLLVLASVVTYYNEGLLIALLLTVCPTYAVAIHLVHVGWTGPTPYPTAVVMAPPLALLFGIPLGLIGGVLGLAARRYTD
ncbi:hypothetical protein [Halosimplex halobium]|uniref:hypothetical protein n=1 Tax=Halosimplex halobium TaxID=3396618 RepID=UPI003F55831E